MNAFKRALTLIVLGSVFVVLSWSNGTEETVLKLDLNAIYGATSFHTVGAMDFAERVKEYSDGNVVITVHSGGSLGFKGPELLKSVKDAQVPMSDILMGGVAGSEHVFGISSLPRLASSFNEAKSLYSDSKPFYEKAAEKWNQKFLYAAPWPPSGLVTQETVTEIEDIKGLKTRTYDKNGADFLRDLKAAPVAMPWGDVYASLRTGVIDSVLTSAESTKNGKLWEVLDYFTDINYAFPLNMVTVNMDYWESMSSQQQKVILKAANEVETNQWNRAESLTIEALNEIEKNGITIVNPTERFSSSMDQAADRIVSAFIAEADESVQNTIEAYLE